jgi:hypothetical protein
MVVTLPAHGKRSWIRPVDYYWDGAIYNRIVTFGIVRARIAEHELFKRCPADRTIVGEFGEVRAGANT